MKEYSVFKMVFLSFFSAEGYRDVGRNWKGAGVLYLLLIAAVLSVLVTGKYYIWAVKKINTEGAQILRQIPAIRIEKGQVSADVQQPYSITLPGTGKTILVIDTTGRINSLEESDSEALLTKTMIIYRKNPQETRIYNLSAIKDFTLTQERINGWVKLFERAAFFVVLPFVFLSIFMFRMAQALVFGLLGKLFAAKAGAKGLVYKDTVRLAAVAITPAMIISTAFTLADVKIPLCGLCFFLLSLGYLYFALKSNAPATDQSQM